MSKHRTQQGLTLIGILFWAIVIIFVALLAMKLVPAYTEFFTIQKILRDMGSDPAMKSLSNGEIREKFTKRAMIDNINAVKSTDLDISREGGITVVSVEYPFQAKLVGNVSLLVEFAASSDGAARSKRKVE
jgi:hypothetical protein